MADLLFTFFDRISYAWAVIAVAILFEIISGFLFNAGSGIVKSGLMPKTILNKKQGFAAFVLLTLVFGILDPQGVIQRIYSIIHADSDIFGTMGFMYLLCIGGSWIYFNVCAGLDPLSLGSS